MALLLLSSKESTVDSIGGMTRGMGMRECDEGRGDERRKKIVRDTEEETGYFLKLQ